MDTCLPRFFKHIVSPSNDLQKLVIPQAFANVFGRLTHAYVSAPNGVEHEVKLTKENGKLWLSAGWQEFATRYSLARGHALVFQYNGNSRFHVSIFDASGYEIAYPVFDYTSPDEDTWGGESSDESEERTLIQGSSGRGKGKKFGAIGGVECRNPHFIVTMTSSYVQTDGRLWIPSAHVEEHLKEEDGIDLVWLQVEAIGEIWPVHIRRSTTGTNLPTTRFSRGWMKFVDDNGLKVGDVCLFELVSSSPPCYRVRII